MRSVVTGVTRVLVRKEGGGVAPKMSASREHCVTATGATSEASGESNSSRLGGGAR